ncbi:hypothetical protein LPW11_02050 [Geomonas sp. RF6]|uniref:hypothetical protein n=1 Tax=Geomonas sp. RF6 TaxID=2897342 RepID=UPI001E4E1CBB|nr:hypothetical protein [Geomonas sp. RF6]UFS70980.1 hypothetical protein LPW11_02050 [Geomonas sp. RF6]
MWLTGERCEKVYPYGKEDWAGAARRAASCLGFRPDVEEEAVCDDERSCYNCRYRRWTATSFTCQSRCNHYPATACQ